MEEAGKEVKENKADYAMRWRREMRGGGSYLNRSTIHKDIVCYK